jgi:hypothetical protein
VLHSVYYLDYNYSVFYSNFYSARLGDETLG